MTETVTSPNSAKLPPMPVWRFALGVATGLVLAASLLAGCKGGTTENVDTLNADTITVDQHLYLKGPDGTKYEISIGKDASGKDVVIATRAGG